MVLIKSLKNGLKNNLILKINLVEYMENTGDKLALTTNNCQLCLIPTKKK